MATAARREFGRLPPGYTALRPSALPWSGLFSAFQFLTAITFASLEKAQHPELDPEVYMKTLASNGL